MSEGIARVACLAAVALILLCGCASTREPEPPTGPHFSVLTYNVNFGGPRPGLAAKAILDAGADVVCLQETTPAWEKYLLARLKETYPHAAFRHFGGAGGQAVLSRFPVKEIAYVLPEAGWFPGWIVEVETPVGSVQILNVHLRPAVSDRGSFTPGSYYSTKATRLDEIRWFYARLNAKGAAVVLGDFNEDDSGRAVQWLRANGMNDALRQFDRDAHTWRWRTSVGTVYDRLDHILYSPRLHCFSARVIKAGASDHLPVVAVFGAGRQDENVPEDER
ncbi:MAG: endonuclease/exonuclease/phosphatase family protein [Planctomycetota bacterium]